jgi:hypothetical protein
MPDLEKTPRRSILDYFYVTGNLRIVDFILAIPPGLSVEEISPIIDKSHKFDIPTILTAMTGQVDMSGLAPNFAGVDRSLLNPNFVKATSNAQDVLLELIKLGGEKLLEIGEYPNDIKAEIFVALGSGKCTLRALNILDQVQGEIIARLRSIRETSPIALAIRQANEKALYNLYANPENRRLIISHLNPQAVGLKNIYAELDHYYSQPRIVYTILKGPDGRASHVNYAYYLPNIFKVRLGKDFRNASVGELVETITPDIYRKFEGENIQFDPKSPWGFIALLRDFGTPFLRIIADQIKASEDLRKKVVSEQANLDAIRDHIESR